MAVSRVGVDTDGDTTNTTTAFSFSHTTSSTPTLLILIIHMEGDETVSGLPTWDSSNFTLIKEGTAATSSDFRSWVYGFINPGNKTANIVGTTSNANYHGLAAIAFAGTDSSSVASATNFLSEDSNTSNTSTNVHASAGSSGNALLVTAGWRGGDLSPSSVDNSFVEIYDRATGADITSDCSHTASWLANSAPSAVTITMGGSDQNDGIYIELVAAGGGGTNPKGPFGMPFQQPFVGPF